MVSAFKKFIKLGVLPGMNNEEYRRVIIVTVLLIVGNLSNLFFIADYIISGHLSFIIFDIPILIAFPLGLFLVYKKKYKASIWMLIAVFPLYLTFITLARGDSGYDFLLLAFCFIVFVIVENKTQLILITLYVFLCFLLMHAEIGLFVDFFKSFEKDPRYYFYINIFLGVSISILSLYLFKSENKKFLATINEQNTKINNQKEEIERQNLILEQSNQELQKSNKSKDKFLSILSHDLISPFNSILGLLELLDSEYEEYTEKEKKEMISQVYGVAGNTYSLLINILSWAKSQTGNISLNKEKACLLELIKNSIEPYMFNARQKKLKVSIDIKEDFYVKVDIPTFETIIRNLFNNAVKFTHTNGHIDFNAKKSGDKIHISVTDSGIGMDKKTVDNLFDKELSSTTTGTHNEKGTGLGLLVCKEFVELNGGTINVTSEKEHGSTFEIILPA